MEKEEKGCPGQWQAPALERRLHSKNQLLRWARPQHRLIFLKLALVLLGLLAHPQPALAQGPVTPEGTTGDNISLWLPEGSVEPPVVITADYQRPDDLPPGVSYPPASVGWAFTFGLWQGENVSLSRFDPSIVLSVKYQDAEVELAGVNEEELMLMMYDPATRSWLKACSKVDIYLNSVSAALADLRPFPESGGNLAGSALLVIAADTGPDLVPLTQVWDENTLGIPGSGLRLRVMPGTLDLGSNLLVTYLPGVAASRPLRLLSRPADVKVCWIDHDNPAQNSRQVAGLDQALTLSYEYDADTLSRAGGRANLTMAGLRGGQWIDLEELGFRVIRASQTVAIDTRQLGTFGLAAR